MQWARPAQMDDLRGPAARKQGRHHRSQQRGVGPDQILELHREAFDSEHAVGRGPVREHIGPERLLGGGVAIGRAEGSCSLEVEIFERRAETARLPEQMGDVRAPGPRHGRQQIAKPRRASTRREIELGFIAGEDVPRHASTLSSALPQGSCAQARASGPDLAVAVSPEAVPHPFARLAPPMPALS